MVVAVRLLFVLATRENIKMEVLGDEVLKVLEKGTGQVLDKRRNEFVGASVGDELAEQGGLAMLTALICILVYVAFRFRMALRTRLGNCTFPRCVFNAWFILVTWY